MSGREWFRHTADSLRSPDVAQPAMGGGSIGNGGRLDWQWRWLDWQWRWLNQQWSTTRNCSPGASRAMRSSRSDRRSEAPTRRRRRVRRDRRSIGRGRSTVATRCAQRGRPRPADGCDRWPPRRRVSGPDRGRRPTGACCARCRQVRHAPGRSSGGSDEWWS